MILQFIKALAEYEKMTDEVVATEETLKEWIEKESRYQFWARCEYEFLVLPWPYNKERDKSYKLDVFEQIMFNRFGSRFSTI